MVENQNYGPLVRGTERSARWYIAERLPQNEFRYVVCYQPQLIFWVN